MKISLKCACGQQEVVQLGDVSRGFGFHADKYKVIVVNLRYFSVQNPVILPYKTSKWFLLCDIINSEVTVHRYYIIITSEVELVKLGNECQQFY